MYKITQAFHNHVYRGEIPCVYLLIYTARGIYIFADKYLGGAFRSTSLLANGSAFANGLINGSGDICAVEISDRLVNTPALVRSVQPKTRDVINSLTNKEKQNITVELDNHDFKLSRRIVRDPLLTKLLLVWVGFESDTLADQYLLFAAQINEIEINKERMTLFAEEL